MIILGIDPGTANTGYGVVSGYKDLKYIGHGVIKTSPKDFPGERLRQINNQLSAVIKKYQPDILAIEEIYFFVNAKTAMPVSQAKGSILLTAARKKIPVKEYSPLTIKLITAGSGRAKKKEVQIAVQKILQLKDIPKPDHAADALAVAITCITKIREA